MISDESARPIINASLYFNELFKKVVLPNRFPIDVTKTQLDVLIALHANGRMSMTNLSARVGIAPEQATRALRGLREAGLAESERSSENRRIVMARLTEKGEMAFDDFTSEINRSLEADLDGLTPEDIEKLAEVSRQAITLFRKTGFRHMIM